MGNSSQSVLNIYEQVHTPETIPTQIPEQLLSLDNQLPATESNDFKNIGIWLCNLKSLLTAPQNITIVEKYIKTSTWEKNNFVLLLSYPSIDNPTPVKGLLFLDLAKDNIDFFSITDYMIQSFTKPKYSIDMESHFLQIKCPESTLLDNSYISIVLYRNKNCKLSLSVWWDITKNIGVSLKSLENEFG